ncbi:MAG TPA: nitroreductase/quinone reductase family protein [Candidatus Binatia bacterium]|nr:nitroreductase/quinone reductase family protein [Candidatus Binatia bacterium]
MKRLLVAAAALVAALAALTVVALEGKDVAVLHTRDSDGIARATRVWIVEEDGAWWVEAAIADRPFYVALQQDARLEVEHRGEKFLARATLMPNPEGHERIRRMLRSKYGWADDYIGLLQDTSNSLAVRLDREAMYATESDGCHATAEACADDVNACRTSDAGCGVD